jgi:hypothetical protein
MEVRGKKYGRYFEFERGIILRIKLWIVLVPIDFPLTEMQQTETTGFPGNS